jgi:hypothetical protein
LLRRKAFSQRHHPVVNYPSLIFKKEELIEAPPCLYKGGTGSDVERRIVGTISPCLAEKFLQVDKVKRRDASTGSA